MAFSRFFSLFQPKKPVERLTPEQFRDKYFQMTPEDIKKLSQESVSSSILYVLTSCACVHAQDLWCIFTLATIVYLGRW